LATTLLVPGVTRAQEPDSTTSDSTAAIRLPTLEVTVARVASPLADVPYAISTVDVARAERGQPTDALAEILRSVPGVLAQHRYNYALDERISIRGFGARSAFGVRGVRVVLDGIPQTLPDGQGQLTDVEPGDLESVEVFRGAASALWGNAAGGVINLRSARGPVDSATMRLQAVGGGRGFHKGQLYVANPLGNAALRTSVSWTGVTGARDHSAAELRRASARYDRPLSPTADVGIVLHVADDPWLESPGALTQAEFDSSTTLADPRYVATDAGKSARQGQGGVTFRKRWVGGSVEAAAYGLTRHLENPLPFARIGLDRRAWGARTVGEFSFPIGSRVVGLTAGVDAQWQRDDRVNRSTDSTELTLSQLEHVSEFGPFVAVTIPAVAGVSATAGVRWDRVAFDVADRLAVDGDQSGNRVMSSLSASAGVTVRAARGWQAYASVGTAFETPTTTELVNRPDGQGGLNPAIAPQRAVNMELGLRGVARGVEMTIAVYDAEVRDALVPFEDSLQPGRTFFRNAGKVRHQGVEVAVEANVSRTVALNAAYTYARHRFVEFTTPDGQFEGNVLPGVPPHLLSWSVNIEPGHAFWMSLDNTYQATLFTNDANTASAGAWWLVGLRAGWLYQRHGFRVTPFVTATNLFDRAYVASVVVNARGGRYFEPGPGREVMVGAGVGF